MSSVPIASPSASTFRQRLPLIVAVSALALAVLLALAWWRQAQRLDKTARELARRQADQELVVRDEVSRNKQLQESLRQITARYAVLESKQAESQSQQLALEQMYQTLSRSHDDTSLVEVEQIVGMAAQQLQLAGNVNGAVSALQAADARLARDGSPRLVPVRRAIGRDLERLRAVPSVDAAGIALKLEQVAAQVDSLPLLAGFGGETELADAKEAAREESRARVQAEPVWWNRAWHRLRELGSEFVQDASQLIRIRKVETPEALLLAPPQTYFVRENLRLRLLNARFALLARQEALFRADMRAARDMLARYFDVKSKAGASALHTIKSLETAAVAIELPTLNDTVAALRSARPARDAK
jgi:uroporphyrin-3 C-methyltransferase